MTQEELIELILDLRCCSARLAYNIAENMINGDKSCKVTNLMLLNDNIDSLLRYEIDGSNCTTEDEFEVILDNAKQICKICNCD